MKFFEMIFNACPKKSKIFELKKKKSHDFWQSHPKEKLDTLLSSDLIDNSELESSLLSDFQKFIQNTTPGILETYFSPMDKTMICKICCIEKSKALLCDPINSKEHKDSEKCFIMKCMTYREFCDKEIKMMTGENIQIHKSIYNSNKKMFCKFAI